MNGHKVETVRVRGTAVDVARVHPLVHHPESDDQSIETDTTSPAD